MIEISSAWNVYLSLINKWKVGLDRSFNIFTHGYANIIISVSVLFMMTWTKHMLKTALFPYGIKIILQEFICIVVEQRNPSPEDQNNSSEMRLLTKLFGFQGWDFFVPQQYIMEDTFYCPLCVF